MSTRYFLALNGLKGDSLNSNYKGWFELSSFDIDLAGAGAGTAAFSPLTLTLDSNSGLAPLLALAATGERLSGATLVGVTDGAGQAKVYQLDLADVLVTNVEHHADSTTEAGPTLTLDYSKIELETFTPDGKGGTVPEGQFGFDLTANMAGITVPSADPGGSVVASPEPRDYFMLIDGLNGGSLDKQHIGWFEIRGVDLDMEKLAAGDFASLNVTVPGGVELADVMKMAATGTNLSGNGVIRGVHIEGFTAGKVKVYDLTLANVAVNDVAVTNAAGSDSLEYSLSLDYSKIALVTNGIDGSGQPIENGEFGYDVTTHTKIAPFSLGLQLGSESAASGSKYFLALDNVRGDLEPAFKGTGALTGRSWFEVNSFDIDMEGRGLPEAGSTQKVAFSPLTLTLDSNTALAPLLTMAATGDPNASTAIKAATLVGVKSDGQTVSYRLDLGTLQVTKVEDVANAGLTVSLDFGEIKLWTFTQDKNGVVSHANDFTWNVPKTSDDVSDMPSVRDAGTAPSPEPATYFMLIDGLNGGSTDASHKGWFELSGFDFDLTNPTKIGSASGGAAGGKPQFSSLNVTLPQEAGLADLMGLAATGGLIKGVRIEGFTGGTTPAEVYELTLADVAATKVADGEDGGYSLSLDYGKIALVTKTENGKQTTQFTYDVDRNATGVSPNPSSLVLSPDSSGGSVTPAKYFLALDGVKGDSLNSTHKGWFEVSNFDLDLSNPLLSGVPGSPSGQPGKAAFSPLTLTLDSNTGLAPLLTMAATGGHLNGATLVGVTAGAQAKVYQLDLADVLVTKVEDDAGAGLTLSLDYLKIELETFTQKGTSGTVPEGQFGFDRTVNTGGITVPSALPSGTVDPSPQPAHYFMLIDGLNGGSQDTQHKGWFEITGFDFDLEHVRLPASGEANFSPLNVTLGTEVRLAEVMDLAATGGQVKGVRIEGVTGGATPAKVFDLTLADVTVTKVVDGENDGYSLSLDYGKIALVTDGIDATGQRTTTNGEFGFDVTNAIEIDPFTLALSPNNDNQGGSLAISDVTITEGNAGTQNATFTVVRSGGTGAFAVNFATADGSATAGSDYAATSGTLSFGDGVNTQTISVPINGDTTIEPNETFFINLSGATAGATISDGQGVGTIINDDQAPASGSLAISDVTITEGNAGTQNATFTVVRSGGTGAFAVNFATADGSATAGSDYAATSGTLSFGGGVNTQTISVPINGDTTIEPNETFFINLSGATNGATISDGQGVGTIINDDQAPASGSLAISDVTITEGNAGTQNATFTVVRSGGTGAFAVNFATADGTATAGSDYAATSGTLSFGNGVNTQTISVPINGDTTIEPNETFFINLSGATNGATISDGQGVGTIINDDQASSLAISDVAITEGNAGTQNATFTVVRSGGTGAFAVNFATADGSAMAGSDYAATSGTLLFGDGVNTQTISVPINGDTTIEPNETFFINLSGATNGATISDGQGVGTIINDDQAGSLAISDVTITEGNAGTQNATFTVVRSGGASAFAVNFATADGTATAGSDYAATSGTLSFGDGVNTRTISVPINGDTTFEQNETFFINLSGATNGATIADGQGVGTIINNDPALLGPGDDVFVWNPGDGSAVVEGQAGTDTLQFNGANIAETINILANGERATFLRDVANIKIDLNDVENINFRALGGPDIITINDLSGTDVTSVAIDLAGTPGGTSGDGQVDIININATNGSDFISVVSIGTQIVIVGLAAQVIISNVDANDRVIINGLGGNDVIFASAPGIMLTVHGGDGDDVLFGGSQDVLDGGPGNNTIIGLPAPSSDPMLM